MGRKEGRYKTYWRACAWSQRAGGPDIVMKLQQKSVVGSLGRCDGVVTRDDAWGTKKLYSKDCDLFLNYEDTWHLTHGKLTGRGEPTCLMACGRLLLYCRSESLRMVGEMWRLLSNLFVEYLRVDAVFQSENWMKKRLKAGLGFIQA